MPFFERDGLALHYSDEGTGPPVLLIHGWGGRGRRQWHATMLGLRDRYRFVALDLRGHGSSAELPDPAYGWTELVGDCEALRSLLGIGRWTVVGYSFGGVLALEYARLAPSAVVAVCAVAPMVLPPAIARLTRFLKIPIATLLRSARNLPPEMTGKTLHNIAQTRLRTLFHTVRMMEEWTTSGPPIPQTVPVVVMVGERDRVAHSEHVLPMAPHARMLVIPDAGHFPLYHQREQFVEQLDSVLHDYAK